MTIARIYRLVLLAILGFGISSVAFGDGDVPTLDNVHKTLLQAAGYQADTPPTVDEQTELLHKALKMIHGIPHVYRGELKRATEDINLALSELGSGDTAHKARELIFQADDEIKALM